jgi:hypothetical protein
VIDHDVVGSVTSKQVVPGRTGKMQFHTRLHLRQFSGSGNITSFSRRDKGFASNKAGTTESLDFSVLNLAGAPGHGVFHLNPAFAMILR